MAFNFGWDDYGEIRREVYRDEGKVELKALSNLPSKSELKAAFDFVATALDNNKSAIKTGIDNALGITTTPQLSSIIFKIAADKYLRRYV